MTRLTATSKTAVRTSPIKKKKAVTQKNNKFNAVATEVGNKSFIVTRNGGRTASKMGQNKTRRSSSLHNHSIADIVERVARSSSSHSTASRDRPVPQKLGHKAIERFPVQKTNKDPVVLTFKRVESNESSDSDWVSEVSYDGPLQIGSKTYNSGALGSQNIGVGGKTGKETMMKVTIQNNHSSILSDANRSGRQNKNKSVQFAEDALEYSVDRHSARRAWQPRYGNNRNVSKVKLSTPQRRRLSSSAGSSNSILTRAEKSKPHPQDIINTSEDEYETQESEGEDDLAVRTTGQTSRRDELEQSSSDDELSATLTSNSTTSYYAQRHNGPQSTRNVFRSANGFGSGDEEGGPSTMIEVSVYPTPKTFKQPRRRCSFCPKTVSMGYYRRHKISHLSPKAPVQCDRCDKMFVSASSLKTHMENIHYGICNYECYNCKKQYYHRTSREMHKAATHDNVRYFCSECKKQYRYRSSAVNHTKSFHMDDNPHMCNICDKTYPFRSGLVKHMKSHLPRETPANKPKAPASATRGRRRCSTCSKEVAATYITQHKKRMHPGGLGNLSQAAPRSDRNNQSGFSDSSLEIEYENTVRGMNRTAPTASTSQRTTRAKNTVETSVLEKVSIRPTRSQIPVPKTIKSQNAVPVVKKPSDTTRKSDVRMQDLVSKYNLKGSSAKSTNLHKSGPAMSKTDLPKSQKENQCAPSKPKPTVLTKGVQQPLTTSFQSSINSHKIPSPISVPNLGYQIIRNIPQSKPQSSQSYGGAGKIPSMGQRTWNDENDKQLETSHSNPRRKWTERYEKSLTQEVSSGELVLPRVEDQTTKRLPTYYASDSSYSYSSDTSSELPSQVTRCYLCKITFPTNYMVSHLKIMHPPCPLCLVNFKTQEELDMHTTKCTGKTPRKW